MKEYEYSFKVKDIKPYIKYCKDEGYEYMSESKQIRELYRNSNKTLARITINKLDGHEETYLDFKDDNNSNDVLKVSRETVPLKIEKYNKEAVYSILEMLGYKKDKVLSRTRIVYKKDGDSNITGFDVTFEITISKFFINVIILFIFNYFSPFI